MKILALSVLLVAMMVLALANEAVRIPELEAVAIQEVIEAGSDTDELEAIEEEGKCRKNVVKTPVCTRGWIMIGKTCYRYFAKAVTWAEAQAVCKGLRGNLASVHNKVENNRLWTLSLKKSTWIGYSDAQQEHHWFWIDGTALNYKNWCKGQPNNGRSQEHCAVLWKGQNCWHDYHCSAHRFPYICARAAR